MKLSNPQTAEPVDSNERRAVAPVICYPVDALPPANPVLFGAARQELELGLTQITSLNTL